MIIIVESFFWPLTLETNFCITVQKCSCFPFSFLFFMFTVPFEKKNIFVIYMFYYYYYYLIVILILNKDAYHWSKAAENTCINTKTNIFQINAVLLNILAVL